MRAALIFFVVFAVLASALALLFTRKPQRRPLPIEAEVADAGAPTWAEARAQLTPAVFPAAWLAIDLKHAGAGAPALASRPFGDGLIEVVDDADGMISQDELNAWHVDAGELFEAAERNLRTIEWSIDRSDGGVFAYTLEGERDPTALLTWPETFENLPIQGEALVGVCGGGALVADSASQHAVSALLDCLEADGELTRPDGDPELVALDGRILTLHDGRWAEWKPGPPWAARYQGERDHAEEIVRKRTAPPPRRLTP